MQLAKLTWSEVTKRIQTLPSCVCVCTCLLLLFCTLHLKLFSKVCLQLFRAVLKGGKMFNYIRCFHVTLPSFVCHMQLHTCTLTYVHCVSVSVSIYCSVCRCVFHIEWDCLTFMQAIWIFLSISYWLCFTYCTCTLHSYNIRPCSLPQFPSIIVFRFRLICVTCFKTLLTCLLAFVVYFRYSLLHFVSMISWDHFWNLTQVWNFTKYSCLLCPFCFLVCLFRIFPNSAIKKCNNKINTFRLWEFRKWNELYCRQFKSSNLVDLKTINENSNENKCTFSANFHKEKQHENIPLTFHKIK